MITRDQYMMGRDSKYPTTEELEKNAAVLLFRVNRLLRHLNQTCGVSSGYRPGHYNQGYAPKSAHLTCEAVDLIDLKGELKALITPLVLEQFNLWAEDLNKTPTWLHLQSRPASRRIFLT